MLDKIFFQKNKICIDLGQIKGGTVKPQAKCMLAPQNARNPIFEELCFKNVSVEDAPRTPYMQGTAFSGWYLKPSS